MSISKDVFKDIAEKEVEGPIQNSPRAEASSGEYVQSKADPYTGSFRTFWIIPS